MTDSRFLPNMSKIAAQWMYGLLLIFFLLIRPETALGLTGRIDLNSATQGKLQELPYIGESRARAIVRHRSLHGPFTSLDQLLEVNGIGRDCLDAVKPYLTIGNAPMAPLAAADFVNKITTRPGDIIMLPDGKYYDTLVDFIRRANHSIDMVMFLFKTTSSPQNRPSLLIKELEKARKKGVVIHILLENSGYDDSINKENQKVAQALRKSGIKVSFDSAKTTTHAKIVVIDRRYAILGSHNLTHSALAFNHEFSLLIDNTNLASELTQYIESLR
ncbi:MAG: phospholipase D-like domain-containing protein [Pseudomonadota bacterium]